MGHPWPLLSLFFVYVFSNRQTKPLDQGSRPTTEFFVIIVEASNKLRGKTIGLIYSEGLSFKSYILYNS